MALNAHFDQGGGLDSSGFSAEQSLIQNLYTAPKKNNISKPTLRMLSKSL